MKKKTVLFVMIVFLVLIISVSAGKVDYKIEEELEDNLEVSVIVVLKDDTVNYKGVSTSSQGLKRDLIEDKIENRKSMVRGQQYRVLSKLELKNNNKKSKTKGLFTESVDYDFEVEHSYSVINGFSGKVTKKGLEKLKNNPNVLKIYPDSIKYLSLSSSVSQINANDVWPLRPNGLNLTGKNQTICIIDSGIDYTHPNLGNCSTDDFTNANCSKVLSGYNYCADDSCSSSSNDPMDNNGHGTHVAGIIISNHTSYRGVAPDAKIVAIKSCNSTGGCPSSRIISGIDWCIANKTKFNISIITMSLGGGCYSSICDGIDPVVDAANNATSYGIFVDASSGNDNPGSDCIASPACGSNVTAVGGIRDNDITIEYDRAPFMSILAPSQEIISTVLRIGGINSDSSGFLSLSGTSMAAPHVAGVAALMLQFNSSLSALDIRNIMGNTGKTIDDSGTTYKRVDALAAIQSLDITAPAWYGNATNNTAPKYNSSVQFNITFNDTIGLSSYVFSWNDTGIWVNLSNGALSGTSQAVSVSLNVTATRGMNIYWKFYANDTNDNWGITNEWNFIVHNTIPAIVNLSIISTDSMNMTNGSLAAYFDYFDIDNDANTLNETRWYNNSNYISTLDNITLVGYGNLSEGEVWLFSIRAYDGYNLSAWYNSSNITINIDTFSPSVSVTSPSNGSYIANSNVDVAALFSDHNVVNCKAKIDDGDWQDMSDDNKLSGTAAHTFNSQSDGNHNISINCTDSLDNSAAANSSFIVDTLDPAISLISNFTSSWTSSSTVYFIYNVTDTAIANCSLIVDDVIRTTDNSVEVNTSETIPLSLSNANYNWSVNCTDRAGNKDNSPVRYLTVSYTSPIVNGGGSRGGSGGGRGGGGGTSSKSPTEASRFFVILTETFTPLMAINSKDIAVKRIGFKVNKKLNNVRINVKVLNKSGNHPRISAKVYQYLDLDAENLNQSSLSQMVEIKFKVANDWLKMNGIEENKIILHRYNNGWNRLNTSVYLRTNESTHYVSYSPGFSFFAIADTQGITEIKDTTEIEKEENKTIEELPPIIGIEGGEIQQGEKGFFVITGGTVMDILGKPPIVTFVLLVMVLAAGLWLHKKKSKP